MSLRNLGKRVRRKWPAYCRVGGRCLLALLTGCRSAALPYSTAPGDSPCARSTVLARQVMVDSAVEVARQPLTTSWHCLTETTEHLTALAEGEFGKRVLMPLQGTPQPLAKDGETLNLTELDAELQRITGEALHPAQVQLQVNGAESLEALDQLIAQATTHIDVIMFQWENDELGKAIAGRLAAVAGPNLHVRILIDGGGNLYFSEPDDADATQVNRVVLNLAHHPYIEVVRIRNPFARYDHRKIVIVDGRHAWTGGRNFCRCAFFAHHDLTFVVDGPLVAQMQRRFDNYWERQGGQAPAVDGTPPATAPTFNTAQANCHGRWLHSEPGNHQLATAIYEAVDRAQHHIYLENVYLTDSRLIVKLAEARRRGVDVRVVFTIQSTSPIINQAMRAVANRLVRAGVRVYLYPGMTHAKAMTVDGLWAYIGTGNLDPLSLRHNNELGLSISGSPMIGDLEQRLFLPDMRPEWEMSNPLPLSFDDWLSEWVASLCL
jgi:cardiolipin synthase